MGLMSNNYQDQMCIVVILKLQVFLPKNGVLLLEVLHLLGVLMLHHVHLPL